MRQIDINIVAGQDIGPSRPIELVAVAAFPESPAATKATVLSMSVSSPTCSTVTAGARNWPPRR